VTRVLLLIALLAWLPGCGGNSAPSASGTPAGLLTNGADPILEIKSPSGSRTVALSQLIREVPVKRVTVNDPLYGRDKTYDGFSLEDLASYSQNLRAESVIFHCRDGFSLRMPFVAARKAGLVLTFHDLEMSEGFPSSLDNPIFVERRNKAAAYLQAHHLEYEQAKHGRTPAQKRIVQEYETARGERDRWARRVDELNRLGNIGPFHPVLLRALAVKDLVDWDAPDAVRAIEFEHVVPSGGRDYPAGAAADSPVMTGYKLFHAKCLYCHAMNGGGGRSGPELNIPVNVTEYLKEEYVIAFILNARAVRARSMMSVQPEITRQDAERIVDYLKYMKNNKRVY